MSAFEGTLLTMLAGSALLLAGVVTVLTLQRRAGQRALAKLRRSEERLRMALWATGELFWDYECGNDTVFRLRLGASGTEPTDAEEPGGRLEVAEVIHPDDLDEARAAMQRYLDGESDEFVSEHRIRQSPDGPWAWVRARGRAVERDDEGRVTRVAGNSIGISRSRGVERERQIAREVLRSMNEAVAVLDRHFRFVAVNPAFTRISGYAEGEVLGQEAEMLDSTQHDSAFYQHIRTIVRRDGHFSGEMWQRRKDGEEFLCALECNAVVGTAGSSVLFVCVLTDITLQKRAEQELRYLANFDTLTNLPNRSLLSERLSRAIVRARREGNHVAVLFLDLDRFKDINDSLGHAAGDRILRATAKRLQETVGEHQTVARLSGDEFTIVLENLAAAEEADHVAREIITSFEAPLEIGNRQEVVISPSIGISLYPDHAQVPTELLKQADTAMYQAKSAGRRTYMRYDDAMDVSIRKRAILSGALRKALDHDEFRLVYQPRLALDSSAIVGVEALLRWNGAEHGAVPPDEFIPLAEESGQILEIGEWVLREACLALRRWQQHGLAGLSMAVNVSVLQLLRGNFPEVVRRILEDARLDPRSLELELTESVLMANAGQTAEKLLALRKLGVSLAIDDFGTGYSSLAYLKRLPITTLKIDKAFIRDVTTDPEDAAITSTIITMAHSLGLRVVAEGVETEAQMRFLVGQNCDEIQGFWLARPLEAHACLAFMRGRAPQRLCADGVRAAMP
ncbi:putative bifunctional diguanylate cyclase/phosphodiesterase [Luteimonas vadosa]|uniref:putative bifunctional diguanylate cyclase/phosphodiesterase n=1 Tax=Luteimonas vadosa TaxID=1165507 RepID=UPI0031ED7D66